MKLFGHSVHQMLIVFPAGLLAAAVLFEFVALATDSSQFWTVAYWTIAGGIIGGLAAAVFGLLDWLRIPGGTRANRIAIIHAVGNVIVLALFAASWWLRGAPEEPASQNALFLSYLGLGLLVLTGWLGGELVDRLSVGVDDRAHLDASNSVSAHGVIEQTTSYRRTA
jgi:uncharacterized membrane protein